MGLHPAHRLSLGTASGSYSLWFRGFSLQWLLFLWSTGSWPLGFSSSSPWALEHWLGCCGRLGLAALNTMWDLPGPGIKSVSLALQGGVLTTGPQGKPCKLLFSFLKKKLLDFPGSTMVKNLPAKMQGM